MPQGEPTENKSQQEWGSSDRHGLGQNQRKVSELKSRDMNFGGVYK